jgi:hypothetical protein
MASRVDVDRSVGQLLSDVTKELQALVRKEFELAKEETSAVRRRHERRTGTSNRT